MNDDWEEQDKKIDNEDGSSPEEKLSEIDPQAYQFYDEDELNEEEIGKRSPFIKFIALITVLGFLVMVFGSTISAINSPIAELLPKSLRLKKDLDINMLDSVVQIKTVSRKNYVIASQSSGTGFNIHPGGIIVTNYHVIEEALTMVVTFPDGKTYKAESWVSEPEYDLAIIKLDGSNLPNVPLNTSHSPAKGEKIKVVGNPLSYNNVVVEGKVDSYIRVKGNSGQVMVLDAPIHPGNSGSPVFNDSGEVVGVVFGSLRTADKKAEENNKGLAVPIGRVLEMLKAEGALQAL